MLNVSILFHLILVIGLVFFIFSNISIVSPNEDTCVTYEPNRMIAKLV